MVVPSLKTLAALAGLAALPGLPLRAQTDPPKPKPKPKKVVRKVHVVTQNVFDPEKPGEDKAVFRFADRLHLVTRPEVVERQLLLRPGDEYSPEKAAESARILRNNRYLYDADVRPVDAGDGEVDLEVVTRDVWTLQGGAGFHRSGGANSTHLDIQDLNFLGRGKAISVSHETSVDRTSNLFNYTDPSLLGTHGRLDLAYAANSDGRLESVALERPFYSLDSRWAVGALATLDERVDPLYDRGHVLDRFQHQKDVFQVYAGLSPGLAQGAAHRWRTGFTFERDRFAPASGFDAPTLLPADRTLAYPWIEYSFLQDGYFTARDLDRIQRTEDVNLGRQLHVRLGWSSAAWGGDTDRLIADAGASLGWKPSPRQLVLASFQGGSRLNRSVAENLLAGGSLKYYARDFGDNLLYVGISGDVAHDLDPETQLLLGGDTGLRGYPLRYLQGDHRLLFTAEQRFFSNRELFHLFHLGAAAFFDAGYAWFEDGDGKIAADRRLLKDVGVGLRFGSSRSARGSMIHLDLAYPLDGGRDARSLQWLVSTSETF
jgi:outer membrane translocation and assembly module TamA